MLENTLKKYFGKINFAFVFYSDKVTRASIAAECAHRQNKFWEMKEMLYTGAERGINKYIKYANSIGLDTIQFKKDFDDPDIYKITLLTDKNNSKIFK